MTRKTGNAPTKALGDQLRKHVGKEIGKFARPNDVRFTDALPKTHSGKIMRRLLRDIARVKNEARAAGEQFAPDMP